MDYTQVNPNEYKDIFLSPTNFNCWLVDSELLILTQCGNSLSNRQGNVIIPKKL